MTNEQLEKSKSNDDFPLFDSSLERDPQSGNQKIQF
jgi:hypothetical protein